jgi:hypothetical protein
MTWQARIEDAAKERRLVALVGAGPSMAAPANLPSWPGLLAEMATHMDGFQPTRAALMREETAAGRLLDAAELYADSDRVPPPERAKFFRNRFDTAASVVPESVRIIASLPCAHWVTTNFDNNLYHILKTDDVELVTRDRLSNAISLWNQKRFLVHLHGRALDYESLVYRRSQYHAIGRETGFRDLVKEMFTRDTVLAIGYSFGDPDISLVLEFIRSELSAAVRHGHVYLHPSDRPPPAQELLAACGFEFVTYDPANDHQELYAWLRRFASKPSASGPSTMPYTSTATSDQLALASIVNALSVRSTGARPDLVVSESLVLRALGGQILSRSQLIERVARLATSSIATAEKFVDMGLTALKADNRAREEASQIELTCAPSEVPTGLAVVVEAVETRLKSLRRVYASTDASRRSIRAVVSRVLVSQGMGIAKSLVNEDPPDMYNIERQLGAALAIEALDPALREPLREALLGVLADPSAEVSRELFSLAHSAFVLESVFLNPTDPLPATALNWIVFLDSNVMLRVMCPVSPQGATFGEVLRRLQLIGTPLRMLGPFIHEIIEHAQDELQRVKTADIRNIKQLEDYLAYLDAGLLSPLTLWWAATCRKSGFRGFEPFIDDVGFRSEQRLTARLKSYGVEVVGQDANARFDNSKRETLWDDLRQFRPGDQGTIAKRKLRRNEATQVLWLEMLRGNGQRGWFVSIDGQLRQALKVISRGDYAGYVVTPAAWAHLLSGLDWRDIEFSGFTEMMWSLPAPTLGDKLTELVLRRIVDSPLLASVEPEVLRDRVEAHFDDNRFAAPIQDDNQSQLMDIARQLVPKTADAVLDSFARGKGK